MKCYKSIIILLLNYMTVLPVQSDLNCPFDVGGLIATVFTPFDNNYNLNLDIVPQYARYLKDNNIKGVFVAGYIGEGTKLSVQELKDLTTTWVNTAGPLEMKVLVLIGGRPFPETFELVKFAEDAGVDGIAILPDLFYKPKTTEDLIYAFESVAKAAPNTYVIYHDIPNYSGVNVNIYEFFLQAMYRVPNFKGISVDGYGDSFTLMGELKYYDEKIFICNSTLFEPSIYMGMYDYIFPELNFFPKKYEEGYKLAVEDISTNVTYRLYEDLYDYTKAIFPDGYDVPTYKATMKMLTGIDVGPPREPQKPLNTDGIIHLKQRLQDKGIDIPV